MKTWMCWVLLVVVVGAIALFAYWLTSSLPVSTCIYITIGLNFLVSCYLIYTKKKESAD